MWTARCDNVHRVDDEETISERERTHTKLKKFWVRHVGMKSVGKSTVEVCILQTIMGVIDLRFKKQLYK